MKESNKRLKTKRIIENAMVQLLMDQPFDQISTVKLAEKAGISRSIHLNIFFKNMLITKEMLF